VVAFLDEG